MSGYIGTQPVPQATQTRDSFTATSGQTTFATGGYTPNFLDVYLNGVKLAAADYTATNGSDVVLASGAATGDILEVVAYTTFTVGSSFTPSIDDNGNATALTIDSSENVLIGMTTASTNNDGVGIRSDGLIHAKRANVVATFNRKTSDGSIIELAKDNTVVGSIGTASNEYFAGGSTGGDSYLRYGYSTVAPSTSSGANRDNVINLGASNARFKDAYIGGGVYLGGTGSANKLDDYEEGTWTPSSAAFTISSVPSAKYTKVGRLVTLQAYLEATSGNTNLAKITGLPFSCVAQGWSTGVLNFANSNSTVTHPHVRVRQSESALDLKFGNDSTLNGTACDAGPIIFTVTYETSS